MGRRGRPPKFEGIRVERLTWLLAHGLDRGAAAEEVGIGRATFYRWMVDPRPEYEAFRAAVGQAEAQAEAAVVMNLVKRSETDWRAGLAWLRARYPERWGRPRERSTPNISRHISLRTATPPSRESSPGNRK